MHAWNSKNKSNIYTIKDHQSPHVHTHTYMYNHIQQAHTPSYPKEKQK